MKSGGIARRESFHLSVNSGAHRTWSYMVVHHRTSSYMIAQCLGPGAECVRRQALVAVADW